MSFTFASPPVIPRPQARGLARSTRRRFSSKNFACKISSSVEEQGQRDGTCALQTQQTPAAPAHNLLRPACAASCAAAVALCAAAGDANASIVDSLVSQAATNPVFLVSIALGLSAFTQALSGFGFSIVAVGLLTQLPWIANSSLFNDIQPIAAIFQSIVGTALLLPELNKIDWKTTVPLLVSATAAIPIGLFGVERLGAGGALHFLGGFILAFVLYLVSGVAVPKALGSDAAGYLTGALSGVFGGAFDIPAPPVVFYGNARGWDPDNFRRNVLSVDTLNSMFVVVADAFAGRLDDFYVGEFVVKSIPMVIGSVVVGKFLGSRMDATLFRQVVLGICFVMGVRLLMT